LSLFTRQLPNISDLHPTSLCPFTFRVVLCTLCRTQVSQCNSQNKKSVAIYLCRPIRLVTGFVNQLRRMVKTSGEQETISSHRRVEVSSTQLGSCPRQWNKL